MPKIKTNRAAAKRFKATGGGGLKRKKAYHSHLLASKSPKRKRSLRAGAMVDKANLKALKRILPHL